MLIKRSYFHVEISIHISSLHTINEMIETAKLHYGNCMYCPLPILHLVNYIFCFYRRSILLCFVAAGSVVVLSCYISLLEDTIPFSCKGVRVCPPHEVCTHCNGIVGTCTATDASYCHISNYRIWSYSIPSNLMYGYKCRCDILLSCAPYHIAPASWNYSTYCYILDNS